MMPTHLPQQQNHTTDQLFDVYRELLLFLIGNQLPLVVR